MTRKSGNLLKVVYVNLPQERGSAYAGIIGIVYKTLFPQQGMGS
ncbi:MAG: hypothetical protein ACOX2B_03980 [Syntrophothermaceae bacterium]